MNVRIEQFYPKITSDEAWEQFFEFRENQHREIHPDDPLPSRRLVKKFLMDPHPDYQLDRWMIRGQTDAMPDKLVGLAHLETTNESSPEYETNKHIVYGSISIDKPYRRQGIGGQIFYFS